MFFTKMIGLIFSAAGIFLALRALSEILACHKCKKWAFVRGSICSAEVTENNRRFTPVLTYQYKVNGQALTGTRISPGKGQRYTSAGEAHMEILDLQPDTEVLVFYDPQTPANAVLQADVTWAARVQVLTSLIFTFCGVVVMLV